VVEEEGYLPKQVFNVETGPPVIHRSLTSPLAIDEYSKVKLSQ
jgi:hypothetical protein